MTADGLLALLDALGSVASPEAPGFTELDHALQCAFELATHHPDDVVLHVAGLVHDIGHRFGDDASHGRLGAAAVRPLLGARIAALVEDHVPAKRYLVAVDPSYPISAVSSATLAAQGGPLSEDECRAFAARPWHLDALALRRADDAAKVAGRVVPPLESWTAAVRHVARAALRSGLS